MAPNDDEIKQATRQLTKAVAAKSDPAERAIAAGETLDAIPSLQTELRKIRQAAAQEMRASGMSWAAVGAELGVTRARAKQIAEGRSENARSRRAVRTQPDAEE